MPSRERLEAKRDRLELALRTERAAAALERHGVPEHFAGLLTELEPDQIDAAAQAIASEIHPAGSSDPVNQEHGGSPTELVAGGDLPLEGDVEEEDQDDLPPERLEELAATTRGGAEVGQPPVPYEGPKDATTRAIRSAKDWTELEQVQAQAGARR